METRNYTLDLAHVFTNWMRDPGEMQGKALNDVVVFAYENGVDLELKVPKSILREGKASPMSLDDFNTYASGSDEMDFVFFIPCKKNMEKAPEGKRLSLNVNIPDGRPNCEIILNENGKKLAGFEKQYVSWINPTKPL